ncbi:hypothetical protein [Marinicella meishanensis]|uniref:hypothetical protein n=1 Tax=Marinicella meishanensis TaxID=2873263 RepID=UPI001CBF7E87|nr:hypothetical protein [Marinicella sp. NBU2979]
MKKILCVGLFAVSGAQAGGVQCVPDVSTAFTDTDNQAFSISYNALGNNVLYRQCTNMSNQTFVNTLNTCSVLANPIDGLGLNPIDRFLYGLMPTDAMGIGTHLELTFPFPAPGQPGDMMVADPVDVYRIGNDGGYQRIGSVQPPAEDVVLPPDNEQVIPIVHSAASFDPTGNLYLLGYKTNYESSADVMAGTGEVLYQVPRIMIGQVTSAALTAAAGGDIPAVWAEADTTTDATCAAVMNQFRDRTNTFSQCVVADFIANGNADQAVTDCLASTGMMDYGINDFAVSPVNGNYYALDTMSFDTTDVLIEVDSNTMQASCTNFPDPGSNTGVLTSLMFSAQNKLVAIFANENTGRWINVSNGVITTLPDAIDPYAFGDGSSLPFAVPRGPDGVTVPFRIFATGFENDLIFATGFEGTAVPPTCPAF